MTTAAQTTSFARAPARRGRFRRFRADFSGPHAPRGGFHRHLPRSPRPRARSKEKRYVTQRPLGAGSGPVRADELAAASLRPRPSPRRATAKEARSSNRRPGRRARRPTRSCRRPVPSPSGCEPPGRASPTCAWGVDRLRPALGCACPRPPPHADGPRPPPERRLAPPGPVCGAPPRLAEGPRPMGNRCRAAGRPPRPTPLPYDPERWPGDFPLARACRARRERQLRGPRAPGALSVERFPGAQRTIRAGLASPADAPSPLASSGGRPSFLALSAPPRLPLA